MEPPPHRSAAAQVVVADVDDPGGPALSDDARRHLGRALRLRPGEVVCAADGRGAWRLCTFTGGERLEPGDRHGREPAPTAPTAVAFVPVKGDRPELVVQKLTELGVDRIVVTSSARAVVRWDADRTERHLQKLRRVALEAFQQCRRLWLPDLSTSPLADLLAAGAALTDMGGAGVPTPAPTLVVGPEGGWTDDERGLATVPAVGLGRHVLRAETAAIAAGVLLTA